MVEKVTEIVNCEVSCKQLTQVGVTVGCMVHGVGVHGVVYDPVHSFHCMEEKVTGQALVSGRNG